MFEAENWITFQLKTWVFSIVTKSCPLKIENLILCLDIYCEANKYLFQLLSSEVALNFYAKLNIHSLKSFTK